MSSDLVLAVDCSTTACKAIAFDAQGKAHAQGRAPIALDHPAPEAWEQDAEGWWQACVRATRQAATELGPDITKLRALCVTHQRETFVLTDETGQPLAPALVWMDTRCRPQVKAAIDRHGENRLHELSGKPPCTTPSLYKLMYLLEQQPALAKQKPRVLDVHGFIVWRLTDRFATSLASADPLGLIDMRKRQWSVPLFELAGIGPSQVPELVTPGKHLGRVAAAAASACGLPPGLPVIAGAGDGQCAGLGTGIRQSAQAYLNLGTAIVSGVSSPRYLCDRAFRTLYGPQQGTFFLETDLQGGTFTINWLIDHWLRPSHGDQPPPFEQILAELEQEAANLAPGATGLMLIPYWNGVMNPYWDDEASGLILGLSGSHRPAHLYRAILEGIAFEQRVHTTGVEQAAGEITEMVVLGGGSKSDLWCQILADVLNKDIVRARGAEATALGAGVLAATAVGLHQGLDSAVAAMTATGDRFVPGAHQNHYERLYEQVYKDLYPAMRTSMHRLRRLSCAPQTES